jgi:hypothetical protein
MGSSSSVSRLVWLVVLGLLVAGCGRKADPQRTSRSSSPDAVVGRVEAITGQARYSEGEQTTRQDLEVGQAVRAGWRLHTGPDSKLTLKLVNGHLWSLAESLTKRAAEIQALDLPAVMEGTLAQLADQGGSMDTTGTSAAGVHHERTAGTQAASSRLKEEDRAADTSASPEPTTKALDRPMPVAPGPRPTTMASTTQPPPRRGGRDKGIGTLLAAPGGESPESGGSSESLPEQLGVAQVRSAMNQIMPRLRACFDQHRAPGTYRLQVVVRGSSGRVSSAVVVGFGVGTPAAGCLQNAMRGARFTQFRKESQTFVYPVSFR